MLNNFEKALEYIYILELIGMMIIETAINILILFRIDTH